MFYTRRGGFDAAEAQAVYEDGQRRRPRYIPRVGDKVVLSDHKDAQVYTITEVYSHSSAVGMRLVAHLMYVSEYGKQCNGGDVDCSSLLLPSEEQLNRS